MASKYEKTKYPGIYRRGKGYTVKQRDGAGRLISRSASTLAEAKEVQAELQGSRTDGTAVARSQSFSSYADEWIDSYTGRTGRGFREHTRAGYKAMLNKEAKPFFGRMQLRHIQPRDLKAFAAKLSARGLKPSSVKRYISPVKALLATAFEEGVISVNPAANVRIIIAREYNEEPTNKALSDAQLAKLLDSIDPDWRVFAEFLAHTGMRIDEAVAVRWKDLDLNKKTVRVQRASYKGTIGDPKSKYGKRVIPLSPRLASLLDEHYSNSQSVRGEDPLFATSQATMLDPHNFRSRVMRPAAKASGVEWATPHTLRHTFASRCFRNGCNVKQVQAMLGHHSPAFTLETYVHLLPEDLPDLSFLG